MATSKSGIRAFVLAVVFALVVGACGDGSGTSGRTPAPTSGVVTDVTGAVPTSDPPPTPTTTSGGPGRSIDDVCADLAELIAAARDGDQDPEAGFDEVRDLVAELAVSVLALDSASPELRRAVAEMLTRSLDGEGGDDDALEAFEILIHEFQAGSCEAVVAAAGLTPGVSGSASVLTAVATARAAWADGGLEAGEYTVIMWPGLEEFEEPRPGDVPPCGYFGQWLVVVTEGVITRAVDKFSGCEIDLDHPSLAQVPATVAAMFDFIEANADSVRVDFMRSGAPRLIELEREGAYFSISVQEIWEGHPAGPDEVLAALAQNRALWVAAVVEDYTITMSRSCFCMQEATLPYTVVVRDGEVVSTTRDGIEVELMDFLPRTVEDLFREVEQSAFADSIVVEYDTELGYPLLIDLDPVFNAVDEESRIDVSSLVVD